MLHYDVLGNLLKDWDRSGNGCKDIDQIVIAGVGKARGNLYLGLLADFQNLSRSPNSSACRRPTINLTSAKNNLQTRQKCVRFRLTIPAPPLNDAHHGGFLFCAMKFEKLALTVTEQVALLRSRGMVFLDDSLALRSLSHLNYYRLRGYWSRFEIPGVSMQHQFSPGTTFEQVLELYRFDQQLKLSISSATEVIEVSLRTKWAHELSIKYGSHAYLKPEIFKSVMLYAKHLGSVRADLERSKEAFIRHYQATYSDPDIPPIWSLAEIMTFGQISVWLNNLRHSADRQLITKDYGFDEAIVCPFFHHLSYVRNVCAHHGRLWNRRLTVKMQIPRHVDNTETIFNRNQPEKIYNTLVMVSIILNRIDETSQWNRQINQLIQNQAPDQLSDMGFPFGVTAIY